MRLTFGGLTKISKEEALKCAFNTICFIERLRNAYFNERVEFIMATSKWTTALLNDCFIRYLMNGRTIPRELAKEIVWNSYFNYHVMEDYYEYANSLVSLARATHESSIYITDQFADVILIGRKVNPDNTAGKTATELHNMVQFI
jgi:hypothetical protein